MPSSSLSEMPTAIRQPVPHRTAIRPPAAEGASCEARVGVAPPPETTPSAVRRTLVLVAKRSLNHKPDFVRIRRYLHSIAPDVNVVVTADRRYSALRPSLWRRPVLVFSPVRIRRLRPWRGRVFTGEPLTKSQEYEALDRHGIPVPRWALLTETERPSLDAFGKYVVSKPDCGGRGAEVKIRKKTRVRWKRPENRLARDNSDLVVQEFIYTGPWPVSYRVTTLFGKVLWSVKAEADHTRRPLQGPDGFSGEAGCGMSIVSTGRGCTFSLNDDPEVLALAQRAHGAFPDIPLLGSDIIREEPSGKLYVIEVNSSGQTWHFNSPMGRRAQDCFGFDLESQFDGIRKAAHVLLDQTRRHAC